MAPEPIVCRMPWKLRLLVVGGSAMFVALGLLLLTADVPEGQSVWKFRGAGAASVLFFGGMLLWTGLFFLSRKPLFVADTDGIVDRASMVGAGRIAWAEVEDIRTDHVWGQQVLAIHVYEPERFLSRYRGLKRFFARLNHRRLGTPVSIPGRFLPDGTEALRARIVRYLADLEASVAP